jgi:hypothetical protein
MMRNFVGDRFSLVALAILPAAVLFATTFPADGATTLPSATVAGHCASSSVTDRSNSVPSNCTNWAGGTVDFTESNLLFDPNSGRATATVDNAGSSAMGHLITVSSPTVTSLKPIATDYIQGGIYSRVRYGGANTMQIRYAEVYLYADHNRAAFLKFDLSGITGTVTSALLNLTVTTGTGIEKADGSTDPTTASERIDFFANPTTDWKESTLNFYNSPDVSTAIFGSTGVLIANREISLVPGSTLSVDLTPWVAANEGQIVSLQIFAQRRTSYLLSLDSRHVPAVGPHLVVTTTP